MINIQTFIIDFSHSIQNSVNQVREKMSSTPKVIYFYFINYVYKHEA